MTPYTDLLKQKDQALMRAGIPIGGFMDGGVVNEQVLRVNNQSDTDSYFRQERATDYQGSFLPTNREGIQVEDYPEEETFVYKSHRKNI